MAGIDPNNEELVMRKAIIVDEEGHDINTTNPFKAEVANSRGVLSATNQLPVQIYGNSNRPMQADSVTHAIEVVDYPHHEIHSGSHFTYTDFVELASAATQDYLLTTPNTTKWAHIMFDLSGSAITQFQLYEASDKTGTTPQTIYNDNRNSATSATITIHKGTSGGTTDGTQIRIYKSGASSAQSKSGSGIRSDEEIILKQNTKYILRVTSGTNNNLTNVRFSWYEHTNKE
jgi:hypothetical protein